MTTVAQPLPQAFKRAFVQRLRIGFPMLVGSRIANLLKSLACQLAILLLELDTQVPTVRTRRSNERAARPCEGVQHQVTRFREALDEWLQDADVLLSRMANVSRVLPRTDIIERLRGLRRATYAAPKPSNAALAWRW